MFHVSCRRFNIYQLGPPNKGHLYWRCRVSHQRVIWRQKIRRSGAENPPKKDPFLNPMAKWRKLSTLDIPVWVITAVATPKHIILKMENTWVPIPAVPAVPPFVTQLWTPFFKWAFFQVTVAFPIFRRLGNPMLNLQIKKQKHSFRTCSFHQTVVPPHFFWSLKKSWWFWSPIPNHLRGGRELLANIHHHHHHHHHLGVLDTKFQIQMPFLDLLVKGGKRWLEKYTKNIPKCWFDGDIYPDRICKKSP